MINIVYPETNQQAFAKTFETIDDAEDFINLRHGDWSEIDAKGDDDLKAFMDNRSGTIVVVRYANNVTP